MSLVKRNAAVLVYAEEDNAIALTNEISDGVSSTTVEQDKATTRVENVGHADGELFEGTVSVVVGKVPQIPANEIPQRSRERRASIVAVSVKLGVVIEVERDGPPDRHTCDMSETRVANARAPFYLRLRREDEGLLQRRWSRVAHPCTQERQEIRVFAASLREAQTAVPAPYDTERIAQNEFLVLLHHVLSDFVLMPPPAPQCFQDVCVRYSISPRQRSLGQCVGSSPAPRHSPLHVETPRRIDGRWVPPGCRTRSRTARNRRAVDMRVVAGPKCCSPVTRQPLRIAQGRRKNA